MLDCCTGGLWAGRRWSVIRGGKRHEPVISGTGSKAAGRLLTGPTATFTEVLIGPVPLLAAAVWN
jgi:hypothetical protein